MVQVSKEELKRLEEHFGRINATRTVHKYYIEENPRVMAYLKNMYKKKSAND